MKLGTYTGFTRKDDIQIQTSISRLLVHIQIPNGQNAFDVRIRLRVFGSQGAQPIMERMTLQELFEIAAFKEGHFVTEQNAQGYLYKGEIEIGVDGALALSGNQYLSLDIESPFSVPTMELWAVGGPILVTEYHRYAPVTVQETIKDIPLAGIDSIVVNPAKIKVLTLQYPNNAVPYEEPELRAIARSINDIVSVDPANGTAQYGLNTIMEMSAHEASRCIIEPVSGTPFNVYLLSSPTLV